MRVKVFVRDVLWKEMSVDPHLRHLVFAAFEDYHAPARRDLSDLPPRPGKARSVCAELREWVSAAGQREKRAIIEDPDVFIGDSMNLLWRKPQKGMKT